MGSTDGKASNELGKFDHPHGIDVDSNGYVYVNELENPRIQKFDENGTFIKQWGSEGKGKGEFTPLLEHLEVDSKQDMIFMVDGALNPRIQVFDNDGNFTTSFGTSGSGDGQFSKPEHVNIDSSGNVYVVDRGNDRIKKFNENGAFIKQWDRPEKINGTDKEFGSKEDMVIKRKKGEI